jgi:hypothetical protein
MAVLERPEWKQVLSDYFGVRKDEVTEARALSSGVSPDLFAPVVNASPVNDAVMMMTLGSHNQDRRSMILDGEAMALVTGSDALVGIVDFALLMGAIDWIDHPNEVDVEFSRTSGLMRALVKLIKNWI